MACIPFCGIFSLSGGSDVHCAGHRPARCLQQLLSAAELPKHTKKAPSHHRDEAVCSVVPPCFLPSGRHSVCVTCTYVFFYLYLSSVQRGSSGVKFRTVSEPEELPADDILSLSGNTLLLCTICAFFLKNFLYTLAIVPQENYLSRGNISGFAR